MLVCIGIIVGVDFTTHAKDLYFIPVPRILERVQEIVDFWLPAQGGGVLLGSRGIYVMDAGDGFLRLTGGASLVVDGLDLE